MIQTKIDYKELVEYRKGVTKEAARGFNDRASELLRNVLWRIATTAQTKYLTGGNPLNVRTGRLRASVRPGEIELYGHGVKGSVGTSVFYGRVWEFGAQTPGHIVKPVNTDPRTGKKFKYLRFRGGPAGAHGMGTGGWVSVKSVKLSPKPWLAPATKDTRPFLLSEIARLGMKMAKGGKKK